MLAIQELVRSARGYEASLLNEDIYNLKTIKSHLKIFNQRHMLNMADCGHSFGECHFEVRTL